MCLYPVFCCHGNNIVSGKQKALITAILGESKYWTFRKEECTDPKGLRAVSGTRQASLTARSQQRQAMPALLPYSAHRLEPKRWKAEMLVAWISCCGWEKLNCSLIEVEFSITLILASSSMLQYYSDSSLPIWLACLTHGSCLPFDTSSAG